MSSVSIKDGLFSGLVVRHNDWPPFHYVKLVPDRKGRLRLLRFLPDGSATPMKRDIETLRSDEGWSLQCVLQDETT